MPSVPAEIVQSSECILCRSALRSSTKCNLLSKNLWCRCVFLVLPRQTHCSPLAVFCGGLEVDTVFFLHLQKNAFVLKGIISQVLGLVSGHSKSCILLTAGTWYHHLKHSGWFSNCEGIGLKIESPKTVVSWFFFVCSPRVQLCFPLLGRTCESEHSSQNLLPQMFRLLAGWLVGGACGWPVKPQSLWREDTVMFSVSWRCW